MRFFLGIDAYLLTPTERREYRQFLEDLLVPLKKRHERMLAKLRPIEARIARCEQAIAEVADK